MVAPTNAILASSRWRTFLFASRRSSAFGRKLTSGYDPPRRGSAVPGSPLPLGRRALIGGATMGQQRGFGRLFFAARSFLILAQAVRVPIGRASCRERGGSYV